MTGSPWVCTDGVASEANNSSVWTSGPVDGVVPCCEDLSAYCPAADLVAVDGVS